jgi:lambda family phage portal protein
MPAPTLVAADGVTPLRAITPAPFRASDRLSQELAGWDPMLSSPDAALWGARDDVVARGTDLGRNNGFVAGARQSQVDNVIGANWMLAVDPNWRTLGLDSMPDDERDAWEEDVEEKFDAWANDQGCWVDASRRVTFIGLLRQAFTSWFDAGEFLSVSHWLDERIAPGRAHYATTLQMVSADRLSNPNGAPDTISLRGGIALGAHGEPLGYHIRRAHPYDPWLAAESFEWEYFEREDAYGRPNVLHGFVVEGDGMSRGASPLASVIEAFRLHDVYDRAVAKAALINTLIAATIQTQSALDGQALETMFAGQPDANTGKTTFAIGGPAMRLDRTIVPKMPPGTELKFSNPVQPAGAAYQQFTDAVLRREAAGLGMSFEELSRDFSKTNYSSARASLLGAWKAITGRSAFLERTFAGPAYGLWFEEAVDRGHIELPTMRRSKGIGFYERRSAWLRHAWIGPGRGHIDPVKERQAYQIGRDTVTDTLQSANAEQGRDWRKVARQTAREQRVLARLGVTAATTASIMGPNGTSDNERPAA